ncbi:MAG: hypothetical protein NTY46_08100 [Candidatus Sumerlaeota bacterium]|nr:hypothetical protein [Candidatus Sumerlaeota bacterium]
MNDRLTFAALDHKPLQDACKLIKPDGVLADRLMAYSLTGYRSTSLSSMKNDDLIVCHDRQFPRYSNRIAT